MVKTKRRVWKKNEHFYVKMYLGGKKLKSKLFYKIINLKGYPPKFRFIRKGSKKAGLMML